MAMTPANHIHGNTISHPGNKHLPKITKQWYHLLVQLMITVVIPTATKQMEITSANTNIQQKEQQHHRLAINKLAITPAKTKYQVATQKGNMAITSANNIKLSKNHWQ